MGAASVRRRAGAVPSFANAQDNSDLDQSQSPTVCSSLASEAMDRSFSMARD